MTGVLVYANVSSLFPKPYFFPNNIDKLINDLRGLFPTYHASVTQLINHVSTWETIRRDNLQEIV